MISIGTTHFKDPQPFCKKKRLPFLTEDASQISPNDGLLKEGGEGGGESGEGGEDLVTSDGGQAGSSTVNGEEPGEAAALPGGVCSPRPRRAGLPKPQCALQTRGFCHQTDSSPAALGGPESLHFAQAPGDSGAAGWRPHHPKKRSASSAPAETQ